MAKNPALDLRANVIREYTIAAKHSPTSFFREGSQFETFRGKKRSLYWNKPTVFGVLVKGLAFETHTVKFFPF